MELFENNSLVTISSPMVRYSKLQFRKLVRKYNCHLCFTPMIMADSFIKSNKARHSDFSYADDDRPLVVQFGANNGYDFSKASQLVHEYSDGVDLNCGCPQTWAIRDGCGACLINKPELVADIVRQTRNAIPATNFTISLKIRLHQDHRKTVDFAQKMESAGISFITVHGRTKDQRCEPVNLEAIGNIKSALRIPVVANGDIKTMDDAFKMKELTDIDGVMSARGLLSNPTLYTGTFATTLDCIKNWVEICSETGATFSLFQNHLIYMIDKMMSRADRRYFNGLGSTSGVLEYLMEKYNVEL